MLCLRIPRPDATPTLVTASPPTTTVATIKAAAIVPNGIQQPNATATTDSSTAAPVLTAISTVYGPLIKPSSGSRKVIFEMFDPNVKIPEGSGFLWAGGH